MGGPRSFSIAAAVDAALWMITTGIAMVFILKDRVQEHRQWMTRSFVVALVFLEGRVIGGVTGWENLDVHASETIVWFCLAFSILLADLVLQWQQLEPSRSMVRDARQSCKADARRLHWAIRRRWLAVRKGRSEKSEFRTDSADNLEALRSAIELDR